MYLKGTAHGGLEYDGPDTRAIIDRALDIDLVIVKIEIPTW